MGWFVDTSLLPFSTSALFRLCVFLLGLLSGWALCFRRRPRAVSVVGPSRTTPRLLAAGSPREDSQLVVLREHLNEREQRILALEQENRIALDQLAQLEFELCTQASRINDLEGELAAAADGLRTAQPQEVELLSARVADLERRLHLREHELRLKDRQLADLRLASAAPPAFAHEDAALPRGGAPSMIAEVDGAESSESQYWYEVSVEATSPVSPEEITRSQVAEVVWVDQEVEPPRGRRSRPVPAHPGQSGDHRDHGGRIAGYKETALSATSRYPRPPASAAHGLGLQESASLPELNSADWSWDEEIEQTKVVEATPELTSEVSEEVERGEPDGLQVCLEQLSAERDLDYRDHLQSIRGIGPKAETVLRKCGVHTFYQLALLDEPAVATLEKRLEMKAGRVRRENWLDQAARSHLEVYGESIHEQLRVEGEYADAFERRMSMAARTHRIDYVDDLKRIRGIGPKLERLLNEQGLTTFIQVSLLDDEAVEALNTRLSGCQGRIRRDNWIAQAAELHRRFHPLGG